MTTSHTGQGDNDWKAAEGLGEARPNHPDMYNKSAITVQLDSSEADGLELRWTVDTDKYGQDYIRFLDGRESITDQHAVVSFLYEQVAAERSRLQPIVENVTFVARSDFPGTWTEPVSGKKLYNEAEHDRLLGAFDEIIPDVEEQQYKLGEALPFDRAYARGWNDCRAELRRGLDGLK